jgi:hypothetical protein
MEMFGWLDTGNKFNRDKIGIIFRKHGNKICNVSKYEAQMKIVALRSSVCTTAHASNAMDHQIPAGLC